MTTPQCKYSTKDDLPPWSEKYKRIEDKPEYDPEGRPVYYGKCDCGCVTEDRGVANGTIQLHWCYHCKKMLELAI